MSWTKRVLRGWPGQKQVPLGWAVRGRGCNEGRGLDHSLKESESKKKDGEMAPSDIVITVVVVFKIEQACTQTLRIFQAVSIHGPQRSLHYLTMWGSLFLRQNKSQPLEWEGSITLNRKDTFQYRNTLHVSKNRVPTGNSLGKLLESPWEAPLFGHCCRHCLSILWPWRAAQRRHAEASVLIARWHMVSSPTKKLPDCPCLGQFCHFCGTGRWPLA